MRLFGKKRQAPETFTHAQILAHHHAEKLATAARIGPDAIPNLLARQALALAIRRNLVIDVYQHGPDHAWAIELNHFGANPICPRGHDPRLTCAQWSERYAGILDWPYPQDDGSDDEGPDAA
ncbi:MAG TPA: hypothetical protein VH393_06150 [Ktedonobacterales bacterium]|jgi:hypothetical protein